MLTCLTGTKVSPVLHLVYLCSKEGRTSGFDIKILKYDIILVSFSIFSIIHIILSVFRCDRFNWSTVAVQYVNVM